MTPSQNPQRVPSSEPDYVKINNGSDRDWRLISMFELQKLEHAINEPCVGKNDGCPPGHLKEMHNSGNETIDKIRSRPSHIPASEPGISFDFAPDGDGRFRIYVLFYDAGTFSIEISKEELEKLHDQLSVFISRSKRFHTQELEYACQPDKKSGMPTHPASATCAECHASHCCVIWNCPLREEIADFATLAERNRMLDEVIKKLTLLKEAFATKEMSDCSLAESKRYGSSRLAIEGAIKMIEPFPVARRSS
jgi:hypothetical protein